MKNSYLIEWYQRLCFTF